MAARSAFLVAAALIVCSIGCSSRTTQGPEPVAPSEGQKPSAEASLAERVAAEIVRLRPGTKVRIFGPRDLGVTTDQELQVHLDNLEARCQQAADDCARFVTTFAEAVVGASPQPITVESLRAVLKTQEWVTGTERLLAEKGDPGKLVAFPLVGQLRVVLVQDTPAMTRPLTNADLEGLGLSRDDARQRALSNLKQSLGGFKVVEVKEGENLGLYAIAFGNSYDAATMILHEDWPALRSQVKGELVVAPLSRDVLLFTGTGNERGLGVLRAIVDLEKSKPSVAYPISSELYLWEASGWKPFAEKSAPDAPPPRTGVK